MAVPLSDRFVVREGRIGRLLIALMSIGFLALIAAGVGAAWVAGENQRHTAAVVHTYEVEIAVGDARRLIEQGETTRRGYLLAPGNRDFAVSYVEARQALSLALRRLQLLTSDNGVQRANLVRLERTLGPLIALRTQSIALIERGDAARAVALFRGELGATRLREIRATFDAMTREERRLLALRDAEVQRSVTAFYVILIAAAIVLALVVLITLVMVIRYTRGLGQSRDALRQLNAGLEERVATRTADLTRANDEIQRFAYIVSHDLRSPLVNVMGFTAELEAATGQMHALVERAGDLATEDERLAASEDLPEAIGFIRTSTQKMDRLINAILSLSRQGRRVLTPEPIDVAALVGTIRETIAHRLDEGGATLTVDGALPVVVTDRLALDQLLSNLIDNAVKYLRPGIPGRIVVSGRREGARATIAVADNGRGIDPRDHARVFELFRRSGAQDRPGEGIGLATVRALAYRLGGAVDVTSTLGEGATFSLSLPLTLEPQEKPA